MTAIVGLLASLTALWITVADRRRVIAKERRQEAEEDRRHSAEEAAEMARLLSLARSEEVAQARTVQIRLTGRPTADDPGGAPETWLVSVANRGPLPVTDVQVIQASGPAMLHCSEPFDLQDECTHEVELCASGERPRLAEVTTEFTDAAGRRWQRHLTGGLRLGTLQDDGTYQWDEPRFPEISGSIVLGAVTSGTKRLALLVPWLVLTAVGCLLYILLH
ncbi:hypothetical protein [Streptomyces sp. CB02115]|uniref:hypothetical protein n=1 Tax=Streptomyces sp. CB02115 TaxID=1703939 RepID=UPI00093E0341|nr:hypothetical protein [Streptomyces sp. CB02115]OKJ58976.1 hypothetical protein AMK28_07890 [Streptomyces sp. CB02115]